MGKRRRRARQPSMWVASTDLPRRTDHPFYAPESRARRGRLRGFVEAQCAPFYADGVGRPSLAPGRYFRLLLLGYFEGLDSERAIAWRASGVPTSTRAELARLDRKRPTKGSNDDWTHPQDPDAKITKMKDGRTHLAHKAEQAVDLETGAVVGATVQDATAGDTETMVELNRLGPPAGLGAVREQCLQQMVDQPALNLREGQAG